MSITYQTNEYKIRIIDKKHFSHKLIIKKGFFILFFLVISNLYPQININGFCNFQKISVNQGYNSILTDDFNRDYITDILLYNTSRNKITFILGDEGKNFKKKMEKFSYYPVSDIKFIKTLNKDERKFFFVSREERLAGLNTINRFSTFYLLTKIKLSSYPSKILITGKNYFGKKDVYVYGPSYKGISTFEEKKNLLKEKQVFPEGLFSSLLSVDINYDGFDDIIGLDILKNTIMLFDKSFTDKLLLIRPIRIENKINHFNASDLNNDSFIDLVYSHSNGFDILVGDSVSSFTTSLTYKTSVIPDKFIIEDVNGDGYKDIIFITRDKNSLYISYSSGAKSFSQSVLMIKDNELSDLSLIKEKNKTKLVVLSNKGNVFVVTKFISLEKSAKLFFGEPVACSFFDYLKDGIPDICFVDKIENQLKIIYNHKLFNLSNLLNFRLSSNPTRIVVDDIDSVFTDFYLFKDSSKVIEFYRINIGENKLLHKENIYSSLLINYLELENTANNNFKNFKTYSLLDDNEKIQSFSFQKNKYLPSNIISQKVVDKKKYSDNNLNAKFKSRRKKYYLKINQEEKCLEIDIKR
ncbi:MAG: VCBS repeat-containing protein [Ignavibacteriales bacterium]|nr:VCBS repeat-containing protein [Ignavibacteriales bacterium]